jgi:hypothetical protein
MVAADYAHGKLDNGEGDSSVCANYEKDLKIARDKETRKKQAEKKDSRLKKILPHWDDED